MPKPTIKVIQTMSYYDVLNWCDELRPGLKERVKSYLRDSIIANDIWQRMPVFDIDLDELHNDSQELRDDYIFIKEQFPEVAGLEEDIIFEICW